MPAERNSLEAVILAVASTKVSPVSTMQATTFWLPGLPAAQGMLPSIAVIQAIATAFRVLIALLLA
jgi:hypothetical protein